ncbi:MAG TPA: hypothetical protein VFA68_03940 [Terriglobales bacterium]|nr:hypothetical protein [Terriglobales bacterium]
MQRLLWTGLIALLCSILPACSRITTTPLADVPVVIATCDTTADPYLSIRGRDQLAWTTQDNNYTIVFPSSGSNPAPGTPFRDAQGQPLFTFPLLKGSTVRSGPAFVKGYFKYNIYSSLFGGPPPQGSSPCKDPGLHVKD